MNCPFCGTEIENDVKFCPICGTAIAQNQQPQQTTQPQSVYYGAETSAQTTYTDPAYSQPQQSYTQSQQTYAQTQQTYAQQQSYYQQPQNTYYQGGAAATDLQAQSWAKNALVFGILGISFSVTVYLSFLGIIFGAIALAKSGQIANTYGTPIPGKALVGRHLGRAGLIIGAVITAFFWIGVIAAIFS